MKYRDLLKLCTEKPGCIKTKEQMDADSNIKYRNWVARMDRYYEKKLNQEEPQQ